MAAPSSSRTKRIEAHEEAFQKAVMGNQFGMSLEERGITPGSTVNLHVLNPNPRANEPNIFVGQATIEADPQDDTKFKKILHGQEETRPHYAIFRNFQYPDFLNFGGPKDFARGTLGRQLYPYTFHSLDDIPRTISQLENQIFVWDVRAVRPRGNFTPYSEPRPNQEPPTKNTKTTSKTTGTPQQTPQQTHTPFQTGGYKTPANSNSNTTGGSRQQDEEVEIVLDNVDDDVSDDEDEGTGVPFKRKELNKDDYLFVTLRAKISQVRDFEHPLRPIDEKHEEDLRQDFLNPEKGYDTSYGYMSVSFLKDDIKEDGDVFAMLTKRGDDDRTYYVLNEHQTTTIVDGRHRRRAINKISALPEIPARAWARDFIEFKLIIKKVGSLLSEWEVLMFSKQKNQGSSLVKKSNTVGDAMNGILSYSKIFLRTYGIEYLDARPKDIINDMLNSGFLSLSKSTAKKYVRLSKCIIRYKSVSDFILNKCQLARKSQGKVNHISYFTDSRLLNANEEDMLLMLKCLDGFSSNREKRVFKPDNFYLTALQFINCCREYFARISSIPVVEGHNSENYPTTYEAFMQGLFFINKSMQSTPEEYIISYMSSYSFSGQNVTPANTISVTTKRAVTRMTSRLDSRYLPNQPSKSGEKTKTTSAPVTLPPRRGKRKEAAPIINLDSSDDEAQPQKKKRRTSTTKPTPTKKDAKTKKAGPKSKKKAGHTDSTLSAVPDPFCGGKVYMPKDDGKFDDSLDVNEPPTGYEEKHQRALLMEEHSIDQPFIKNVRALPDARDDQLERDWEENHSVSNPDSEEKHADVSAFLRSVHIPKDHRAHTFVSLSHFKALRQLAVAWGKYSEIFHTDDPVAKSDDAVENWEKVFNQNDYMAKAFYKQKKTELDLRGYCILEGIADPLNIPSGILDDQLQIPADMPDMTHGALYDAVHKTFPGEDILQDENERTEWNPIINSDSDRKDRQQRDRGIARYISTNHLLTKTLENKDNSYIAERRAYLDVWLGIILGQLNTDQNGKYKVYFPRTGGRWLITGLDCDVQVGHNDYAYIPGSEFPGYFIIVSGPERITLWVCDGSHLFVDYEQADKHTLGDTLKMHRIEIPATSVFIGHGLLHHAGDGYTGSHCIRYHVYVTPEDQELPDQVHMSYERHFGRRNLPTTSIQAQSTTPSKHTAASVKRFPGKTASGMSQKQVQDEGEVEEDDVLEEPEIPDDIEDENDILDM